jgi:beta-galactosidase
MGITTTTRAIQIRLVFSIAILLFAPAVRADIPLPNDGKSHKFSAADEQFTIDGQPIEIIAGEMHPSRIPYQFWEDRIKKARAMGLNTVSVYIFWNQLEPTEGKFDFTGNNDIHRFVKLCQDNGLWVALRPGPYVCAETEFGGYPAWLLKHHDMKVRSDDPQFMQYCRAYMQALHDQVGDLLVTHGGPILMVQIENEYGGIDKYLDDLRKMFIDVGFDGQLYTCDHSGTVWNKLDGMPGILRATNGLPNANKLTLAEAVSGNFPVYGSEVYTSWFSVWADRVGGPRAKVKSPAAQITDTKWLVDRHLSFCFYLFDGGTNFGFSNGANGWRPVQTTYDYDAPIDELGRVTPKYKALRDYFSQALKIDPPPIPPDPKVIEIPPFQVATASPLLTSIMTTPLTAAVSSDPAPIHSDNVVTMEDLDQSYGFVLYRKVFPTGIKGTLDLRKALDYSIVMIDGNVVGQAFQGYGSDSFQINLNHPGLCTLDILVYNLGRNSVGINQSISRKGLNENPTLDGQELTGWEIRSLPMTDPPIPAAPVTNLAPLAPAIYTGTFNLTETGETYLDMRNWNFGVVWVNGHNLGRYWDVGADRGLYLPSVWQNVGVNQIVILELAGPPKSTAIQGATQLVNLSYKKFTPYPHNN